MTVDLTTLRWRTMPELLRILRTINSEGYRRSVQWWYPPLLNDPRGDSWFPTIQLEPEYEPTVMRPGYWRSWGEFSQDMRRLAKTLDKNGRRVKFCVMFPL